MSQSAADCENRSPATEGAWRQFTVLEITVLEITVLEITVLEITVLEITVLEITVLEITVLEIQEGNGDYRGGMHRLEAVPIGLVRQDEQSTVVVTQFFELRA